MLRMKQASTMKNARLHMKIQRLEAIIICYLLFIFTVAAATLFLETTNFQLFLK